MKSEDAIGTFLDLDELGSREMMAELADELLLDRLSEGSLVLLGHGVTMEPTAET